MGFPVSASRATRVAQLLGLAPAPPPPGRIPAMLAARRRIIDQPMVPSVTGSGSLVPDMLVSRSPEVEAMLSGSGGVTSDIYSRASANASPVVRGLWRGGFIDAGDGGYVGIATYPRNDPQGNRRHEIMHGYNEAARRGYQGLPFWTQVAGSTPNAISIPLDELLAQKAGGRAFGEIPWDQYARMYSRKGEAGAARVAQGLHAAQKAGQFASDHAPYLAAGAVGTGMLAYGLSQDDEEEQDRQALLAYLRSVTPE